MITVDQYAASVVEKYHVVADPGSPSHRAADEVIPVLKRWGDQYLQGLSLSGAYAKNTAITLSSHVDILVSFSPIPGLDMKTAYWNLFEYLTNQDLRPRTRQVSIQVQGKGLNVDLIPACQEKGQSGQMLYNKKSGAPVLTDTGQHAHLISNSGRTEEICAVKIWRERNSLDFPSLYLELTVLQALEGQRFGQLADNVLGILRYVASRFSKAVVRDPANPDNIISDDLQAGERESIAKAARSALYDENWKKILW